MFVRHLLKAQIEIVNSGSISVAKMKLMKKELRSFVAASVVRENKPRLTLIHNNLDRLRTDSGEFFNRMTVSTCIESHSSMVDPQFTLSN